MRALEKNSNNRKTARQKKFDAKIDALGLSSVQSDRLRSLLEDPIVYIPNDLFSRPSLMRPILETAVEIHTGKALSSENEQALFLQMNYSRHRLCQFRRKLLRLSKFPRADVLELLGWNDRQLSARSDIVTANMGLVLAMAKRVEYPSVEFTDLISEGSMALLRATEKYDCSRGFKFSTYACRAIFKSFSRAAKQNYRRRNMFPAQWDPVLEKDDSVESRRLEVHQDWVDEVRVIIRDNLADLSGIEQSIVAMRFSLEDRQNKPMTLKEVGKKLGLTKERIRQIQNNALGKLRLVAEERIVSLS